MGFIRPATPGFLVTLLATILLAVASFSVPLIRSIYFLKASVSNGYITFGTLGYCADISGTISCSNATVGYEFDINALVGNNTSIQIPDLVVKWLTYALVLHIVAFGLASVAAIFGLLAHVREMSMTCFSSCISGFSATVALTAFIFDIAIFFTAKSRMNSVSGGSASIGNAVWLTLASWILLFFSGCFYSIGRCCARRRPKRSGDDNGAARGNAYADRMRLNTVKAEADRKARLQQSEIGLPSFHEYDPSQPLKAAVSGDEVNLDDENTVPYRDSQSVSTTGKARVGFYDRRSSPGNYARGGYVQALRGTRAIDEYNNASAHSTQPHRRSSSRTQATSSSVYPPSATIHSMSPANSYFPTGTAASASVHNLADAYYSDPYSPQAYGHVDGRSSQTPPQQITAYNPWGTHQDPSFYRDTYDSTGVIVGESHAASASYDTQPSHQPEQNYGVSSLPQPSDPYYTSYHQGPPIMSGPPLQTNTSAHGAPFNMSAVKGPRGPEMVMSPPSRTYRDSPPMYEAGLSREPGQ